MRRFWRGKAGRRHRVVLFSVGVLLAAACGTEQSASTPAPAAPTLPPVTTSVPSVAPAPSPNGVPKPDHVVILVFENKDVDQVLGTDQAPYLNQLAQSGVAFTNFHAETHPSQPNYLALFAGSTLGVTDDSCLPKLTAPNLGNQLLAAGHSFVGYSEDIPHVGFTGCTSGNYAQKHSPWTAFTTLPAATNQPWTAWPTSFDKLPTVAFVIPNLCHDMHDCDVSAGDRWLGQNLGNYATWARTHNSLLIVTFDETDSSEGSNRIVTLVDGAGLKPGRYSEPVDHYRLLRTIEAMYGLPALGRAAAAPPITDIWDAPA